VPFVVRTHPEHRLVVVRTWGVVTADDVVDAATALLSDLAWDPTFALVWDGRAVEAYALGPGGMDRILGVAAEHAPPSPRGPTAILVPRESSGDALARVLGERTGRLGVRDRRVFYGAAPAEEWLGLPAGFLDEP
jgi:hypothetical protein